MIMTKQSQKESGPWLATLHQARRVIRIVIGFTVLVVGVALIVLPGPAIVVIPVGLAILATEFVWARKLLTRLTDKAKSMGKG
jgi:tellurite resistance protein TerC